jgi:hypothetical protein
MTRTLALALVLVAAVAAAEEIRYIGASPAPLWTNWVTFSNCARSRAEGDPPANQKMFCQDGFSGLKPQVGTLEPGTTVEQLDSTECRELVRIRVVTGPLKGRMGCIPGNALTTVKPE